MGAPIDERAITAPSAQADIVRLTEETEATERRALGHKRHRRRRDLMVAENISCAF